MKIAINGNIIDPENIFIITPIEGLVGYFYDGCFHSTEQGKPSDKKYDQYRFEIKLFNSNSLSFMNQDKEKITNFRNKIVTIWLNNQSTIPQINLDEQ